MASLKIFNSVLVFLAIRGTCGSTRLQFPGDNNSEDLISAACSHTLYYQVCVSSLRSDPRSKTADLQGLARIALNISKSYGVATVAHIGDLKSEARGNESLSSCLDECREEYSEAVENLEDVVEALNARSLENVKTLVSSAMTYSDTCEESFEQMQLASPLVDRRANFQIMQKWKNILKIMQDPKIFSDPVCQPSIFGSYSAEDASSALIMPKK